MPILSLKRWERVAFEAAPGLFVHMKLKRLKRDEAKPLSKTLLKVFEEVEKSKNDDLSMSQKATILTKAYELVPEDQLRNWFGTCVKDVEDLEIDGVPITSGPGLLEEADDRLLFWLLIQLDSLSKLTEVEGNGSASRSTLRLVGEGSGPYPAQSTEREAGAEPLTATEITAPESSTAQG